jgi:hypothetical protein
MSDTVLVWALRRKDHHVAYGVRRDVVCLVGDDTPDGIAMGQRFGSAALAHSWAVKQIESLEGIGWKMHIDPHEISVTDVLAVEFKGFGDKILAYRAPRLHVALRVLWPDDRRPVTAGTSI